MCEINGRKCNTPEQFYEACKAAAILGTFQAAYTDFAYLGPVSEEIVRREALLGVSITGMMDNAAVLFDPDVQRRGAELVKSINAEVAAMLGINQAARTTCIKPSGSASCVLGSASGIHPHHAKRYFRRVQANKQEPPLQYFKMFNPRAVEESVWDPNNVTEVVTFLCEVPDGSKTKNQVDAITLLEHVKLTQQNWVTAGTNKELCTQPWLKHNVSNTINVKPGEWDAVTRFIYENREHFAGVSLIPHSGDKDYPQAPFCAVYTPREMLAEYGEGILFCSGIIEDAMQDFKGNLWAAADTLLGFREATNEAQQEWVLRATKFARNYFDGDNKRMTYALKDIYNYKLWTELKREYVDVPWEDFSEEEDLVSFTSDSACAGGACEIPDWLLSETFDKK